MFADILEEHIASTICMLLLFPDLKQVRASYMVVIVLLLFLGICVISYYEVAVVCAASEQCIGGYKSTGTIIEKL